MSDHINQKEGDFVQVPRGVYDLIRDTMGDDKEITDFFEALAYKAENAISGVTTTTTYPISMFDAVPARGKESNWHGGLDPLDTGSPLDSVPTDIVVTKGIGKLVIVVNAGADFTGAITLTGDTVNRNTGVVTAGDTDSITVDMLTTDNSTTDASGHYIHDFDNAYISNKWFQGSVTLSTTNLTLTDVDTYHCSFEQNNDTPGLTINTLDANIYTTDANAEFDCYLFTLHKQVGTSKINIDNEASLHVGTGGVTALANKYERLRVGNIDEALDGTTDGWWVDVHYDNSPVYVEDVTITVWFTETKTY